MSPSHVAVSTGWRCIRTTNAHPMPTIRNITSGLLSLFLVNVFPNLSPAETPLALAQGKYIALSGADRSIWVKGNSEMLSRAVRNLVENAINYSPPGTTVEIVVEDNGILHVLDEGPGIKDDERELIFRRFWRRDRRRAGSAGLGLSIVQRIADAHAASVSVENRRTGGAKFSLSFALA